MKTIRLEIAGVTLILSLCLCLFVERPTMAGQATELATQPSNGERVIGDMTMYTKGPYTAFLCPFNAKSLKLSGSESATITPEFPAQTKLVWDWPFRNSPSVIGFLQVAGYGNYYNTVPQAPITPAPVNQIKKLTVSHDLSFTGTDNGFNVIYDYFLTRTANGNDNHLFEIEVFVHASDFAAKYVHSVKPIGKVNISGIDWTVAIDPAAGNAPDILFIPTDRADIPAGAIDLKAMHDYLIAKGTITGNEFYNGHSLGVETGQGRGQLTVKSVSVTYQSP